MRRSFGSGLSTPFSTTLILRFCPPRGCCSLPSLPLTWRLHLCHKCLQSHLQNFEFATFLHAGQVGFENRAPFTSFKLLASIRLAQPGQPICLSLITCMLFQAVPPSHPFITQFSNFSSLVSLHRHFVPPLSEMTAGFT